MKKLLKNLTFSFCLIAITMRVFGGVQEAHGQTGITPTGVIRTIMPGVTVTNTSTTITSLLPVGKKDTIRAGTLTTGTRPYNFKLELEITTPAVSLPALTLTIQVGTSTLTVASNVSLSASATKAPVTLDFTIYPKGILNTQYAVVHVLQNGQSTLVLNSTNSNASGDWTLDSTIDQPVDVFAQFSGVTLGNAIVTSRVFNKPGF